MCAMARIGIVSAALLAQVVAQARDAEPPRRPTFARVVDAAGAPIEGAVVTFAGSVPHLGAVVGPHDVRAVASDARGRARAQLREGLCYVAWAAAEVDGVPLVADVGRYFGAGALLELTCHPSGPPRRVEVRGLEAWAQLGPLRVFAVTPTPGTEIELTRTEGVVQVPTLPEWRLEVRTADGQPLWQSWSPGDHVEIPPPQRLAVRVVDEHGAPLPGARLEQRIGHEAHWRIDGLSGGADEVRRGLGAVGADGTAVLTICSSGDLLRDRSVRDVLLFASMPGRASVAGGRFLEGFYVDDHRVPKPPADVLQFTLPRVEPLAGWVGAVPAGTVAHLSAVCRLFSAENSYFHDARTFVAPVGADGRVEFAELPAELESCRLTLVPERGDVLSLPLLAASSGRVLPFGTPPTDAPAARLPACELLLQVTDALGGPASGVVVAIVPGGLDGVLVRDAAVLLPLDPGGTASVRLVPGRWHAMVATADGWAAATFECEVGSHTERLAMMPLQRMHLRLLDADGTPVAGAALVPRGTRTRPTGDPLHASLQNLHQAAARSHWHRLQTDADGRAVVPFVPVPGFSRRLRLELGERRTVEFELVANAAPLELRLP